MQTAVKLVDLTDSINFVSDESAAFLDQQTGAVVVVDDRVIQAVEDGEEDTILEGLEDWQEEQVPAARSICADDKRFIALPDQFEFHEYRHIEKFIGTLVDGHISDRLWRTIKGKGAFRHFKNTASELGVIDAWYDYRQKALNVLCSIGPNEIEFPAIKLHVVPPTRTNAVEGGAG